MREFFDMEGPFFRGLSTMADLMILNLLALICCLPVITAGASLTALHYVCLKILRGEESYIVRQFFSSFRKNFRQATLAWLIYLFLAAILALDYRIITSGTIKVPLPVMAAVGVATFVLFATSLFVFPLIARFENTLRETFHNAVLLTVGVFPRTLMMMVVMALPVVLVLMLPAVIPLILMFGISVPVLICAWTYNPVFKRFEDQAEKPEGTDEESGEAETEEPDEEAGRTDAETGRTETEETEQIL